MSYSTCWVEAKLAALTAERAERKRMTRERDHAEQLAAQLAEQLAAEREAREEAQQELQERIPNLLAMIGAHGKEIAAKDAEIARLRGNFIEYRKLVSEVVHYHTLVAITEVLSGDKLSEVQKRWRAVEAMADAALSTGPAPEPACDVRAETLECADLAKQKGKR